jgi:outer membrane protein assembly factor BamA
MLRKRPLLIFILMILWNPSYAQFFNQQGSTEHSLLLESIIINGNNKVHDTEIIDLIGWYIGQDFDSELLVNAANILESSGLFNEVDFATRRGFAAGTIIVEINVKERLFPHVDFFKAHIDRNGYKFNFFEAKISKYKSKNRVEISVPFIGDYNGFEIKNTFTKNNYNLFFKGEANTIEWPVDFADYEDTSAYRVGYGIQCLYYRVEAGIEKELELGTLTLSTGAVNYSIDNSPNMYDKNGKFDDDIEEADGDTLPQIFKNDKDAYFYEIRTLYEIDERNREFYTTSGKWIIVPVEFAFNSKGRKYFKVEGDFHSFNPLPGGRVFTMRGQVGFTTDDTPYYKRFNTRIGYSMRRVDDGNINVPFGGTKYLHAKIDYRSPIMSRRYNALFQYHLFSDVMMNWNDDDKIYPLDPDYNKPTLFAGFGIIFKIPVLGPLFLDFNFPVISEYTDKKVMVWSTFGFSI